MGSGNFEFGRAISAAEVYGSLAGLGWLSWQRAAA